MKRWEEIQKLEGGNPKRERVIYNCVFHNLFIQKYFSCKMLVSGTSVHRISTDVIAYLIDIEIF